MTIQIPLSRGKVAIVDDIDADLSGYKWFYLPSANGGYATRARYSQGKASYVHMHRVILERKIGRPLNKGEQTDHRNLDGLDNQRSNLRPSTPTQNGRNKSPYRNSTSRFKGVGPIDKRWRARIKVDGKLIHLGVFGSEVEAAQAYNAAALLHFGEFANLNPIHPA